MRAQMLQQRMLQQLYCPAVVMLLLALQPAVVLLASQLGLLLLLQQMRLLPRPTTLWHQVQARPVLNHLRMGQQAGRSRSMPVQQHLQAWHQPQQLLVDPARRPS